MCVLLLFPCTLLHNTQPSEYCVIFSDKSTGRYARTSSSHSLCMHCTNRAVNHLVTVSHSWYCSEKHMTWAGEKDPSLMVSCMRPFFFLFSFFYRKTNISQCNRGHVLHAPHKWINCLAVGCSRAPCYTSPLWSLYTGGGMQKNKSSGR